MCVWFEDEPCPTAHMQTPKYCQTLRRWETTRWSNPCVPSQTDTWAPTVCVSRPGTGVYRPFSFGTHHTTQQNRLCLDTWHTTNSYPVLWSKCDNGQDRQTSSTHVSQFKSRLYHRPWEHTVSRQLNRISKVDHSESNTPNARARHFFRRVRDLDRFRTVWATPDDNVPWG